MKNAILKLIAKKIIKKYKPLVIGITGSVGKTSTKEAVYTVVSQKFRAYRSLRNLNTESGLPISVLALDDIPSGKWSWRFAVITRAITLLCTAVKEYPNVLVLEYGADKPGDIHYLVSVVKPDIAVLTAVAPTHLEQFGSVEAVHKEKMKLLEAVPERSKRIYNADLVGGTEGISYSANGFVGSDVYATDVCSRIDQNIAQGSVVFKIHSEGSVIPCELNGVIGDANVSSALAAVAVGKCLGMNGVDIVRGISHFHGKPGHMSVLPGIEHTIIVDDTYNASPAAVKHALVTIERLEGFKRRWAVLADMLELGHESESLHREIGRFVAEHSIDRLVTVGKDARFIAVAARESSMNPEYVVKCADSTSAVEHLRANMSDGDLILIKGSQSMKMERIVKAMMAEPERADELLVRRSFGV